MHSGGGNTNVAFLLTIGVMVIIIAVLTLSGSSFAGAFLLIAALVLSVFILLVVLVAISALGVQLPGKAKKDPERKSVDTPDEVSVAGFELTALGQRIEQLEEAGVKKSAGELYTLCTRINTTVGNMPEEFPKAHFFYNCFLPTFEAGLEKYQADVKKGDQGAEEHLNEFFDILKPALTKQHRGLFSNEKLDLSKEASSIEAYRKAKLR